MSFKDKFLPALKRAAWTALEFGVGTVIAAIPLGAAVDEVDWIRLASVAVVAILVSFLKSLLLSMPEVTQEAELSYLRSELKKLMGFPDVSGQDSESDSSESEESLSEDVSIVPEDPEDTFGPAESDKGEESDGE